MFLQKLQREYLLGANEVYLGQEVVSQDEQSALIAWAKQQHSENKLLEIPRNPGAFSTLFRTSTGAITQLTAMEAHGVAAGGNNPIWIPQTGDRPQDAMPREFWTIRSRVINLLDIGGLEEDAYKGSFLSYISPGGGIHRHRDARISIGNRDWMILRCNILFKRPESGGLPVIEDQEIDVPDRGMWAFFPTERFHSATPVQGREARGLLSFGFLVDPEALSERRYRLAASIGDSIGPDNDGLRRRELADGFRASVIANGADSLYASLLELIVMAPEGVTPETVSQQLAMPPDRLLPVFESLQRAELIESLASLRSGAGRVLVL